MSKSYNNIFSNNIVVQFISNISKFKIQVSFPQKVFVGELPRVPRKQFKYFRRKKEDYYLLKFK